MVVIVRQASESAREGGRAPHYSTYLKWRRRGHSAQYNSVENINNSLETFSDLSLLDMKTSK